MDTWKPSTALGAVALALFVTAVTALTGTPHEMAWYGWLFLIVFSGVLATAHLGGGAIRAGLFVAEKGAEVWQTWFYEPPVPPAPVVVETAPAPVTDDDRGWYLAVEITLLTGQVAGFTDEGLTQIMGSDGRPRMQRFLTARGVLALRPAGYGWADDVTLADALRRLRAGSLAPYPDEPAPEVRAPIQPATRRNGSQRAAKGVIVEGVVK